METTTNWAIVIGGLVLGVIIAGAGGYYFGYGKGYEKAVQVAQKAADTNPYAEIETNPLEKVRINPFE